MVDRVITNPDEGVPTEDETNFTDERSQAAIKAAEDGGVKVGDETLAPKTEEAPKPEVTPRPDNVPEKFWNAEKGEVNTEALLKSQQDLEKQFHSKDDKPPADDKPADEEPAEDTEADKATDAETAIGAAEAEFAESGELSEKTYEELSKSGYTKQMVDRYIAGQVAIANQTQQQAYNAAGGSEENYNAMMEWAATNLESAEIDSFNLQVDNAETMEYAVQQLYTRYQNEADVEGNLLGGDNGSVTGEFFKTSGEMQAAINSQAYKTDPNFQAEVQQKIANAEKNGVRLFG